MLVLHISLLIVSPESLCAQINLLLAAIKAVAVPVKWTALGAMLRRELRKQGSGIRLSKLLHKIRSFCGVRLWKAAMGETTAAHYTTKPVKTEQAHRFQNAKSEPRVLEAAKTVGLASQRDAHRGVEQCSAEMPAVQPATLEQLPACKLELAQEDDVAAKQLSHAVGTDTEQVPSTRLSEPGDWNNLDWFYRSMEQGVLKPDAGESQIGRTRWDPADNWITATTRIH